MNNNLQHNTEIAEMGVPELESEIARIEEEERDCLDRLNQTLAKEDPAAGIFFAQEIHAMKQDKLRLHVEKEFCRKRICRLKFEGESEWS